MDRLCLRTLRGYTRWQRWDENSCQTGVALPTDIPGLLLGLESYATVSGVVICKDMEIRKPSKKQVTICRQGQQIRVEDLFLMMENICHGLRTLHATILTISVEGCRHWLMEMAHTLICILRDKTILDFAVYGQELGPVEFEKHAIGIALREDPCFKCSQYFVIRFLLPPFGNYNGLTEKKSLPRSQQTKRRSNHNSLNSQTTNHETQNDAVGPKLSFVHIDICYRTNIQLPGALAYHCFKELGRSVNFRGSFIHYVDKIRRKTDVRDNVCACEQLYTNCDYAIHLPHLIEISLIKSIEFVSLAWCYRIEGLVKKRFILEDTMNWLSTLGGGYSSLGDYFQQFSQKAGLISITQFKIAMEMGDPIMAAKCRLFYALSQMQQGNLRLSKHILRREFYVAKQSKAKDQKLLDMCAGMWSKLQYFYMKKKIRSGIH